MNNKCDIIKDLLPLYAENMCSNDSRQAVAEHIAECESCRNELKKINTDVAIQADSDVSMFKRIKKRARIEKVVISIVSIVAILIALWFTLFFLSNSTSPMGYEKFNMAKYVSVEEDSDGKLWLCTYDQASGYDFAFPTIWDSNGNMMGDNEFNKEAKDCYGVTLYRYTIDNIFNIVVPWQEKRTPLFNKIKNNIKSVVYYDEKSGEKYTLWERD